MHATLERPARLDQLGSMPKDSYLSAAARPTIHQVIAYVVDQHPGYREIPALVSMVLGQIPQDHSSQRQAMQQLIAAEIRRKLEGADSRPATAAAMDVGPDENDDEQGAMKPARRGQFAGTPAAPRSAKWPSVAAVSNDPLQALVLVGSVWRSWANLTAQDLRDLARVDEARATKLLERVVKLDQLAADMDAAGVSCLANLPDAAVRIEALGC